MNLLVSKRSWLLSPVLFVVFVLALACIWAAMDPAALRLAFDFDSRSFLEILTLPLYALIIPTVWLACPFGGTTRRKVLLCAAVSCVAFMAIIKQQDLHIAALAAIYPDTVAHFSGTPFKMRFLTGSGIPIGAKLLVMMYFGLLFGVFAALCAYYTVNFVKGVLKLHPVAWTFGCLGASGVLAQVFDRLPAWYRDAAGYASKSDLSPYFLSFCTAFEEGGEMMLAAFALIAILQAHLLYGQCGEKYDISASTPA